MSELALYRKYRSADFSQVVGQEHVVATLTNALRSGHVSHAYLFTGPRGVGKTSVARLLARALNCTGEGDVVPCNTCTNCKASLESSLDIIEIDAASNRRIEEIRELRDKIGLAPSIGAYKVYIIDEVHMLTTEAFNALLKTLEEPPAHVVFILATTEAHKLPATIISRTQRFNFRALNRSEIVSHLRWIADTENVPIEDEALQLIAQAARGGFRDAISLLDQLRSGGDDEITASQVQTMLGWSDTAMLGELCRAIIRHKPAEALGHLDHLMAQGAQPGQLALQLLDTWRLLLFDSVGSGDGKTLGNDAISPRAAAATIERLIKVTRSPWPGLSLETAVVMLATAEEPVITTAAPEPASIAPAAPVATAATPAEAPPPASEASNDAAGLWPKVLLMIKTQSNNLYALLKTCAMKLEDDTVTLDTRFNFHRDRIMETKNRQIIEQALTKVYGRTLRVVAQLDETAGQRRTSTGQTANAELISSALEILGGEVVDG